MDDVKWDSLVIETREYLEANDSLGALIQVVELHLQVGQENPNEREATANALKQLLKGREGSPFGRRGQKSAVPATVRLAIDRICNVVEEAAIEYYNHDSIMSAVLLKHARSGGGAFESANDYANAQVKRTRTILSRMFKDGSWDGSVDSLLAENEEQ